MQEQLLERLRDRLGEQAPAEFCAFVWETGRISHILSVICRDFMFEGGALRTAGTGILMSTRIEPRPRRLADAAPGRGFL